MEELVVINEKGVPTTNSLLVAQKFGKEHRNIMRDIRNLLDNKDALKIEQMFYEVKMPDSYGRMQNMFIMNRDGFYLLVMGFNGKEALKFKVDFIKAFNLMEDFLKRGLSNELSMLKERNRLRNKKVLRIREIDRSVNAELKERKTLVREVNEIDRMDFYQLGIPFPDGDTPGTYVFRKEIKELI